MTRLVILFAINAAQARWKRAVKDGASEAQLVASHNQFMLILAFAEGRLNGPLYVDVSRPQVQA